MTQDPRSGAKIGVLVPYTNVNQEPDLELICCKLLSIDARAAGE
ncbi:hypothetical protein [uncultured Ruegeria sp.]|nr:hypothetical protein [uncultured Ruegeria sp.]